MTRYLLIAGHGPQRNGTFDPGATGFITKGEYLLMKEDVFPAMKKFLPDDADVIFFTDHKVSNHGSLARLVRELDIDEVIEFHFDAFRDATARGGHVIIHADYAPDAMDLRIKDAIGSMMKDVNFDGLRFTHRGHRGISGRFDLYNVNMARNNGITYRLLELGFGTNRREADIMVNRVEEYAKILVEAILGTSVKGEPKKDNKPVEKEKPASDDKNLNFNQVVAKTIAGDYGNQPQRAQNINRLTSFTFNEIQQEINARAGGTRTTAEPEQSIVVGSQVTVSRLYGTSVATNPARNKPISGFIERINNNWRNPYRLTRSKNGTDYIGFSRKADIQRAPTTATATPARKTVDQMAREVLRGDHGNGHDNRRRSLGISQAQYKQVRARVNQLA